MGLKGAGPYFERSMSNTVLAGPVNQICELYIHDVLIHGRDIESFLENVIKVFERLRKFKQFLMLCQGHVITTCLFNKIQERQ